MNLVAIQVFLTLASELHFGRTAEQLALSQPRVSRIIRALEDEVGGALFERTSRRVRLTPLGVRLRDALSTPYTDLQTAFRDARDTARGVNGVLRVGALSTTTGPALTGLIDAFEKRHRKCRLVLSEVDVLDPYRALRANEIDVLVSWLAVDEKDLVTGPAIALLPRVAVVAADHPLSKQASLSIEDIADYGVLRVAAPFPRALHDAFHPPFTPSVRPIRRTYLVRTAAEGVQAVALGRVVHLTVDGPAIFRRPDIVQIPIRDLPPLPLGPIWCRAHENQRIRAFAKAAGQPPPISVPSRTASRLSRPVFRQHQC